ncbi:DinB family protein [Streptoalloteichus hindustanus]
MTRIVTELGDELANRRPALDGANSAYALLTHCLGVMEHWVGHLVAGRVVHRDRAAEFTASGPVADLVARVAAAKRRLRADLVNLDPGAPLHAAP